jgi:signal peptidase II
MRQRVGVDPSRLLLFTGIALGGLTFDLVTKAMVFARIGPPTPRLVPLIPHVLELQTTQNFGALWGFAAWVPGSSMIFAGLSVVAAVIICYWLFFLGAASSRVLTIALGLIMAGALGNCYDRLVFGYVRDFVHFHVDPINFDCAIFNFADNMLVAGALTLVLYALRPEEPSPSAEMKPTTTDNVLEATGSLGGSSGAH